MRKRFHLSRRRRALWAGIVLFCLLFQQIAMAAYVCTLPTSPTATAMTGDCASMGMSSKATAHQSADPRCTEHCSDHTTASPDARVPVVPPLLLSFTSPLLLGTSAPELHRAALPDPAQCRPEPPPTLRFCSLLI
jgi:hypothetical protein